ncbi:MAG: hypothetical protein RMI89_04965 [Gloeomargarita sp. SKYBB_i_bin120]|nr:hypothetical protein [Gloeomargarita sp. SKYG98]MCS7292313.1 hypothetical protein [Gloeomargarita sp. SKYB120]MDW8177873.1 hypothetical protein [Gloeomargarita sp. SKYBB_i_bin120]
MVLGRVARSHDRQWLYVELPHTALAPDFQNQTRPYNLQVATGFNGHLRLSLEISASDPD